MTAPGGAGKSTLLRRLGSDVGRVSVVTLGPEHREPAALDAMLGAATSAGAATIAVDDAHHVFGTPGETVLERLVAQADEDHRLVVASRLQPGEHLVHASHSDVEIVTAPELALRIDEIAEAFRAAGGHLLGLECASRVASETGGWPALVHQLAVRSRLIDPDALQGAIDAALEGDFAASLLEDAVRTLPPAIALALERTSSLPTLDFAECTRVLGADEATELFAAVDGGAVMHVVELGHRVVPPVLRRHLHARCGDRASEPAAHAEPAEPAQRAGRRRGEPAAEEPLHLGASGRPPTRTADPLDAALARLRAGDVVGALPLLHRVLRNGDAANRLTARLLLLVIREPLTPRETTLDALAVLERECVARGLGALARAARGAIAPIAGLPEGAAHAVVEEFELRRDERGAALVAGIDLLVRMRRGRGTSGAATALAQRLDELGCADLATWARAAAALLAAAGGTTPARDLIVDAETAVIATGVDAAGAFIDAARALTGPPEHAAALLASSRRRAKQAGLPRLPIAPPAAGARAQAGRAPAYADPRHPHLTVGCFGGFRLRTDGADLDLRAVRPQARALLRMLALNSGSPLHRELIADILWGDLGTDSAVHALHVSVSSLRRALPDAGTSGSIVERVGEAYRLGIRDRHDCDLAEFDDRLAEAATSKQRRDAPTTASSLRRALALYVGEVLPEDGPAEWVTGARERYRTRAAEAASSLAHLELHLGEPRAAVAAASRAVEIDPWLDESWRTLVTVHRSSGDVVAARRAADDYRRMRIALGLE
nr:BTAD domain-containing putative transcriptional regulator [Agromyces bauzanensis]